MRVCVRADGQRCWTHQHVGTRLLAARRAERLECEGPHDHSHAVPSCHRAHRRRREAVRLAHHHAAPRRRRRRRLRTQAAFGHQHQRRTAAGV